MMIMRKNNDISDFIIVLVIAIFVCLISYTAYKECTAERDNKRITMQVYDVEYKEPWTETYTTYDSDGNRRLRTRHHDAEYISELEYEGKIVRSYNHRDYKLCKNKIGQKLKCDVVFIRYKNGKTRINLVQIVEE